MEKEMTRQANRFIRFYSGVDRKEIVKALGMQSASVVQELNRHFGSSNVATLAMILSKES